MLKKFRKVLIIQRRMTHYRVPFFDILKNEMRNHGIELIVAYGDPTIIEAKKNDSGNLSWGINLKTYYFFNGKICWQPFSHLIHNIDAVIITHENKLIFNLIPQWFWKNKKVLLWGHGENLQKQNPDWRDAFKRMTANKADWWLGYTEMSVSLIEKSGFSRDRITVLNNTIDTQAFKNNINELTSDYILNIRNKYNIIGNNIGIFIGSLYEEKRIDFLINSALKIKEKCPDFELIIAGNGYQKNLVEQYASKYHWIHYVGLVKGIEKAALLSLSKIMLNPGLVGLGILDSFISHTPMITTDCGLHSPEVVYLDNMQNGIMTQNELNDYSETVIDILSNADLLAQLIEGCKVSSEKYTLENMAKNFTDGVMNALKHSFYRFSA